MKSQASRRHAVSSNSRIDMQISGLCRRQMSSETQSQPSLRAIRDPVCVPGKSSSNEGILIAHSFRNQDRRRLDGHLDPVLGNRHECFVVDCDERGDQLRTTTAQVPQVAYETCIMRRTA